VQRGAQNGQKIKTRVEKLPEANTIFINQSELALKSVGSTAAGDILNGYPKNLPFWEN
jgi:hypothetical protein